MIQFTNREYPNFHISIREESIEIVVSLNISEDMRDYLPAANVTKSKKRLVFFLKESIRLDGCNEQRVLHIANNMINVAMVRCREAKKKLIDSQIRAIAHQTPRILSNTLFE
jgi:hypothetical protein